MRVEIGWPDKKNKLKIFICPETDFEKQAISILSDADVLTCVKDEGCLEIDFELETS